MKRQVKKMGLTMLLSLAFIIGGMLVTSDVQAQGQSTSVVQAPNGKTWVTTQQAGLTVQSEIAALTNQIALLVQQGADQKVIRLKKQELAFYMTVQEGLDNGLSVAQALDYALAKSSGSGKIVNTTPSGQKATFAKQTYDKVAAQLSI